MSTNLLAATAMTPKVLLSGYVTTSDAAVYTCPGTSTVKIATAVLCNVTGSAVTVSVGVVASGGTAGASHHFLDSYSLAAHDAVDLTYLKGAMLTDGDFIAAIAGTGSAVTCVLTGTVIS